MDFEDKIIICLGCGREFVFTAGEQQFYSNKELVPPKRCKDCRQKRKESVDRREIGNDEEG